MKKLLVMIAAILFVAYYGVSAFLYPKLSLDKQWAENGDSSLEIKSWPEGDAFLLGDAISYFISIRHDQQITIDKEDLGKSLVFEPFKIIDVREEEFRISSRTNVYLREYKLQLVSGEPGRTYFFPEVFLRYGLNDSGYSNLRVVLQPIPVGLRFPPGGAKVFGLKQADGLVANRSLQYLPFLMIGLGIFCGALVVSEICRKIARRRKESKDFWKKFKGIEDIFRPYQDLAGSKDEPKAVLHQAHQILRTLLSRKEGVEISPATQQRIDRVLDIASKAYNKEVLCEAELQEALRELGKIFDFYVGGIHRKGEE